MKPRTYEARNQRPEAGAVLPNVGKGGTKRARKRQEAIGNHGFLPHKLQFSPDNRVGQPPLTAYHRLLPHKFFSATEKCRAGGRSTGFSGGAEPDTRGRVCSPTEPNRSLKLT